MRNKWKLERVEDRLTKELEESTRSFAELGKRYGVSRQAIFNFCQRKGIKRPEKPKRPKREHTKGCSICQSIIRIAKNPRSDFISSQTIKKQIGLRKSEWLYHIHFLRKKRLISSTFGRMKSRKAEKAYQIYFKKRLPVRTIGRQVGLKNFYAIILMHKALGWDVPDPLFIYDGNERRKRSGMTREKRRR